MFSINFSQSLTSLQLMSLVYVFPCLNTVLIAVACAQLQKVKLAILDIRQQHITPHHVPKDETFHKIAKCNLQGNLNACIRHHQEIIE